RYCIHSAIACAAAGMLAGCGGGASNEANAANAAAETEAAPADEPTANAVNAAAPAVATAADGIVTADYMVGKWSAMDEDCSDTIEFRKDGTVMTPIGEGKWTLAGDKLTFDYGDGSKQPASTIKVLTRDRIEITRGSGGKETEKRC
ncbi:MAG: hypothetical protein ACREBK_03955, partial [Sphingomicrobium sp.]